MERNGIKRNRNLGTSPDQDNQTLTRHLCCKNGTIVNVHKTVKILGMFNNLES